MPTYDYVCTACGYEMEVVHSVHADGPSGCPKCGARMRKAIVPLAVHFKGGGWARKEKGSGKAARSGPMESGSSGASDAATGSNEPSGSGSSGSGESVGESSGTKADETSSGEKSGEKASQTAPKDAD
jgi:putative FmdB family regulatory protein